MSLSALQGYQSFPVEVGTMETYKQVTFYREFRLACVINRTIDIGLFLFLSCDPSFQQLLNEAEYDVKNYSGKWSKLLKVYARKEKVDHRRRPKLWGLGASFPREFSVDEFEGKCNSQLFILTISIVICKVQCLREKKKEYNSDAIKEVHAKDETSTLQTGKDTNIVRKIYQLSRFNIKIL